MPGFDVAGDLALSADGRTVLLWQGAEEVASRVDAAIQTFAGVWLYDQTVGVKYLQNIFEKPASAGLAVLRAELYRTIAGTPGIVAVQKIVLDYSSETREATVQWQAQTNAGPTSGTVSIR